eukprot:4034655-Pyramimonas_sp.AAC.1
MNTYIPLTPVAAPRERVPFNMNTCIPLTPVAANSSSGRRPFGGADVVSRTPRDHFHLKRKIVRPA